MVSADTTPLVSEEGQWIGRALAHLPQILGAMGARRAMLVIDRGAARAAGVESTIGGLLGQRLCGVFDAFTPNPSSDQPLAAGHAARACEADAIVALGGGSCMDVAKVGGLVAGDIQHAEELVRGGANEHVVPLPVLAIPTTSGTGSEATHFSAIYVQGKKCSVAHPGMRPRGVILDRVLHIAMPRMVAAVTGLDAMCQAIESLWAVGSSESSRQHARGALHLIVSNLEPSVLQSGRAEREQMMLGANLAGRAINISKTTAAHALSYELTTRCGLAHGHAVALTLGHVAAFNAGEPLAAERVAEACALVGASPSEMPRAMRGLLQRLGLAETLSAAGVRRDQLPAMAEAADTVRLSNNPRRLTSEDALAVLQAAF